MSHFYVKPENIKGNEIYVRGNEAHHVLNVMRLKRGDQVVTFDGLGNEYNGVLTEIKNKSVTISIRSTQKQSIPHTKITLAQSIPKADKMDYIIQKTTELGVYSIIPMVTERTVVKLDKNKEVRRQARWAKIAAEAAKQCGRSDVPEIKEISNFETVVKAGGTYRFKIMPELIGDRKNIMNLVSGGKGDALVFIGPEGGFSPYEIELAQRHNFSLVSLGRYTLRSDTASIAALSILNLLLDKDA